jgi:glycosyltransferase involved in cell wall biosynthesis
MRILHLLASPFYSGPAELVARLAEAQRSLGHEVKVAVDRKRAGASAEEPAAPILAAMGLLDEGLELSVHSTPGAVLRDVRALAARQVDVVHAHLSHDHLLARFGRPRRAALVRSVHAPRSLRFGLPRADAFTVPAPALVERIPKRPVIVLPALVGPEFQPAGDRLALRAGLGLFGSPLIGMVSTFQPSRGHSAGIAALSSLVQQRPQARLVLLGDGALEPRLRAQVGEYRLTDHVTFLGYRSGADYVRHLQALDEVWVLGLGNDWSGRAAAQARACGVRVVAVDEGALGAYADAVLPSAAPEAVASASVSGVRQHKPVANVGETARAVCNLYERCRPRGREHR